MDKYCHNCGMAISPGFNFDRKKYCSKKCRNEFAKRGYQRINNLLNLPPSTIGAMHELLAACDLIKKGFCVFRALNPNAKCDLIILKNGRMSRVEVKTAHKTIVGGLTRPPTNGNHDILALVTHSGEIFYQPDKF